MKTLLTRWGLPLLIPAVLAGILMVRPALRPSPIPSPVGTLTRHSGGTFDYATLRGKVLVVNFWATWCAPCKQELPGLLHVMDQYEPVGAQLLAVNQDGGDQVKEQVEEFLLTHPGNLRGRVVYADRPFLTQFRVDGLPTTYVVDRQGAIVESFLGAVGEGSLERAIKRALAKP